MSHPKRRRCACIHEAGHCLALWYFGRSLTRVIVRSAEEGPEAQVRPDGKGGHMRFDAVAYVETDFAGYNYPQAMIVGKKSERYRGRFKRSIECDEETALIVYCAGVAAQARYTKKSSLLLAFSSGLSDMQKVQEVLRRGWADEEQRHSISLIADQRSRALIRSNQGWSAVMAIADQLMVRGELDGNEVAEICQAAYGSCEPTSGSWYRCWPPTLKQLRAGFIPE